MVCGNTTAVCGWDALFNNGNIISAVYTMYDTALLGFAVVILFFVFQLILYQKTQNLNITFLSGALFASIFAVSGFVQTLSLKFIVILLVFELAGVLYNLIFKK